MWTTADYALIISLCSAAISLAGFVWNIWSKFIFPKARVQISFSYVHVIHQDRIQDYDRLCLTATNHGPGDVFLSQALIRLKRKRFRHGGYGLLNPLPNIDDPNFSVGPSGGNLLPKKLAPGESHSLYFVPNHVPLSRENYNRIGFTDSYGRCHWARSKQLMETRQHIIDAISELGPSREI